MTKMGEGIRRHWFAALMLVLGIAFIAGYFGFWRDQAARCTLPVSATVVQSEEQSVVDDDEIRYEYRIEAEYEVDGETYLYADTVQRRLDVGDEIALTCNPDDPAEAMTPGRARMMWLVPVVGFALVAYFLWYVGLFRKR